MPDEMNIPELVRRAIAQPFVHEGDAFDLAEALHEWRAVLARQWPLWALSGDAFRRLNELPALTYPLSKFVGSICRDEGLDRSSSADGLPSLIDHRRVALMRGDRFA